MVLHIGVSGMRKLSSCILLIGSLVLGASGYLKDAEM